MVVCSWALLLLNYSVALSVGRNYWLKIMFFDSSLFPYLFNKQFQVIEFNYLLLDTCGINTFLLHKYQVKVFNINVVHEFHWSAIRDQLNQL